MLDINFVRNNLDFVKSNIQNRGLSGEQYEVESFLEIDQKRSKLQIQIDDLRAERNKISAVTGKPDPEIVEKGKLIKEQIKVFEEQLKEIETKWQWYMDWFPNMLDADVPTGKDESENVEIIAWSLENGIFAKDRLGKKDFSKTWMPKLKFSGKDHVELGKALNMIDVEQSSVVSGSRFAYLKNEAALLQFGLFELLKNKLINEGFTPMIVPLMVKRRSLYGSSHFPGDENQVYRVESKYIEENQELFLVGSSEPSLFSYYMDKVVAESELPQKFFAYTTCFRTEVGSWGKDVKGIKRVHQFDKLEMDLICKPEDSAKMQEYLLSINEWLLRELKIPYHVILMCSGDSGYFATAKKYDIEGWLPSQQEFIELGSNTNARDYQARRYNTRYIKSDGGREYVHNVNDTGCAMGRMILTIIDNYQQADGSVAIPEVLQKYVGKDVVTPKN